MKTKILKEFLRVIGLNLAVGGSIIVALMIIGFIEKKMLEKHKSFEEMMKDLVTKEFHKDIKKAVKNRDYEEINRIIREYN